MKIFRFEEFSVNEKLTDAGQDYVSKKIAKLRGEGKGPKQAAAIAYSYARRKGYKVPAKNESDNPLNDDNSTLDIKTMTSLQFYKLIDLLEADITAYGQEDLQYYEEMTGLDTGTLLDLYAAYGYNTRKYAETEKLKKAYMSHAGKTWEQIKKKAEEAE